MTTAQTSTDPAPARCRPMYLTALFGAFVITGFGHVLTGHVRRGLLWLAALFVTAVLAVVTIAWRLPIAVVIAFVLAAIGLQLAAVVDALYCGRRPRRNWGRWWSRGLVVVAAFGLVASLNWLPLLVIHQFFEAFSIQTNTMLPAIVGKNVPGICTACGRDVVLIPPEPGAFVRPGDPFGDLSGLCPDCGKLLDHHAYANAKAAVRNGDRFLVSKALQPQRWDVVAFDCPDEPGTLYAKRIVGLPGERVELVDDKVTIDGQVISPPDFLHYLHYVQFPDRPGIPGWGQQGKPALLGPDEYFVLGDFSPRSRDSRLWLQGSGDHPPYAVPRAAIAGVATYIYWPPRHWRRLERE